ncbi:DUF1631 family protein [Aliikangiella marina]|uniref:DUF1631 family protein n=1 Tax=Aliikangiella marina TaxID=1712262 RepID=A0A545TGW6_9GAMM|nr:DUF1631 family protein [Aliikangiella marina]TQV76480.1 DUF1631 family protein [Aliikangiella marina]
MSRQLRNLLKQNRNLEEKIFYDTRATDWREELISSKELSEALSRLATRILESESSEISILKMINDLDDLKGRPLDSFEKNALQVVELIFNYLREHNHYDLAFTKVMNSLQLSFTRLSLNDLSFLDNYKHVAVRFLEKVISLGHHFDPKAGKRAQFFSQAIVLLVDRLANRESVTSDVFRRAESKLNEYLDGFEQKSETSVNKILSEIEKQSREQQANQYTQELISSKTKNEEMPIFLLDFFENLIKPLLHKTIALHGVNSKQCQQLLTDMDTLVWSIVCSHGDPDYNDRYEADVPPAMKRMYQLFIDNDVLTSYVKEFFIEIEDYHSKKLQGQRIQYDVMISADIFADEEYEKDDLLHWYDEKDGSFFDVDSLKQESWYLLANKDENEIYRCRLLMVNHLTRKIYFVNLSGELVVTVGFEDTHFLANNMSEIQLEETITYTHAVDSLLRELTARLDILKREYQLLLKKRARDKEEQHKREIAAREAIQKRIEEEKRQEILRRQEELRIQEEKAAEQRRLEEMDARQRFHIKGIYRKLTPGVVIAYKNDQGRWTEASLSLVSKTTNKHIFTDASGNKVIDPTKQELLDLIGELRIKVVREAGSNRDSLSSLVKERRQKLSQ